MSQVSFWPGSDYKFQTMNMSRLISGATGSFYYLMVVTEHIKKGEEQWRTQP